MRLAPNQSRRTVELILIVPPKVSASEVSKVTARPTPPRSEPSAQPTAEDDVIEISIDDPMDLNEIAK